MKWKLVLNNIGGLRGKHTFNFGEGLNIVEAPNATGKTSLLNGLCLLTPMEGENLDKYLNDYEEGGSVELDNGIHHKITLTRTRQGVKTLRKEIQYKDGNVREIAFMMDDNRLFNAVRDADYARIERWFSDITDIKYYEIARDIASGLVNEYLTEKTRKEEAHYSDRKELEGLIKKSEERRLQLKKEEEKVKLDPYYKKLESQISKTESKVTELRDKNSELAKLKIERTHTLRDQEEKVKIKKDELGQIQAKYKELVEKKLNLEKERESLEKELIELQGQIKAIDVSLDGDSKDKIKHGLRVKLGELKNTLERRVDIKGYKYCPKCGGGVNKEKLEAEIKKLKEDIKEIEEVIADKEEKRRDLIFKIDEIGDLLKIYKELPEKLEEIKKEIEKVKEATAGHEGKITQLKNDLVRLEKDEENTRKELKSLEDKRGEILKENEPIKRKLSEISGQLTEVERGISENKALLEEIEKGDEEIQRLSKMIEKAEKILEHFNQKVTLVKTKMRNEVNGRLKESFEILKLAELERILITDKFEVVLTRKGMVETNLSEMSGTERSIIALLILYTAKQTFLQDFPLFVVDEPLNAADDTRFDKIVKYISRGTPLVIATRNVPFSGQKELLSQQNIKYVTTV